ncbi:hypothetical protein M3Y99_00763900 [Aphelenchoides fujianensis]|nr:hypothetical protein M3Y99_00763900 [Aphelenchoides fujianensis]
MTQILGNTAARKPSNRLEAGGPPKLDADAQKYRITCVHVHVLALGLANGRPLRLHLLLTYKDLKQRMLHRLVRHAPCMLLYALVIIGNRLYKRVLYLPYFFLNGLSVLYIIIFEAIRQYRLRTDPHPTEPVKHTVFFFVAVWILMVLIEAVIFYSIYRDYKFVKDVEENPPKHLKPIVHLGEQQHTISPA